MVYQFKWKSGSQIRINAQKAGERILTLQERLGGKLAPRDLVKDARSLNSPLHSAFEWSNTKAAEKYREQQAAYLLRCLVTVYVDKHNPKNQIPTRVFVNIQPPGTGAGERNYRPLVDVLSDEDLRLELLKTAEAEFKAWRRRYNELQELSRIFRAGDLVFSKVLTKTQKKNKANLHRFPGAPQDWNQPQA